MSILDIRKIPDPVLRERSLDVTKFDSALAVFLDNMMETMYAANGVGLAAPQVGALQRVVVADVTRESSHPQEFVNPVIVESAGKTSSEEGCLSIPEYRDTITRAERIKVRAFDRHGKEFEIEADGLLSCCLQHEIDHLDGILFVDHLSRLKREFYRRWLEKQGIPGYEKR